MKKTTKFILCTLCAAAAGCSSAAFSACNAAGEELTITGSTSVQPLMEKLAAAYEQTHAGVSVNVSGGGSSVGVTDAQDGKSDFGMTSRALKESETEGENALTSLKIADDGIALIVNRNCAVDDVTAEEVKALYESGTAIQNTIVAAISRESGSGTRDAFEELVGISSLYSGQGFEEVSATNTVLTNIQSNTAGNTVGYISMGSLDTSRVKALQFNGVEATVENVSNGAYALSRPFNIVYREGGLSELAQDFIDWIMGAEGQQVVAENGYISVA